MFLLTDVTTLIRYRLGNLKKYLDELIFNHTLERNSPKIFKLTIL